MCPITIIATRLFLSPVRAGNQQQCHEPAHAQAAAAATTDDKEGALSSASPQHKQKKKKKKSKGIIMPARLMEYW